VGRRIKVLDIQYPGPASDQVLVGLLERICDAQVEYEGTSALCFEQHPNPTYELRRGPQSWPLSARTSALFRLAGRSLHHATVEAQPELYHHLPPGW
jgi:hypothetical protein